MVKITFLLLLISFSVQAQSLVAESELKNQREQELHWAKQLFDKHYKKEKYQRYKKKIQIKGNLYIYKDKALQVIGTNQELVAIFSEGILFPSLLGIEFILSGGTQVSIHNLEEINALSDNAKNKRFKFAATRKGIINPNIYFFELTNENATKDTDISAFIKGSTLTFFKEGWTEI